MNEIKPFYIGGKSRQYPTFGIILRFEGIVKQSSDMEKEFSSIILNHEKESSDYQKQQCKCSSFI